MSALTRKLLRDVLRLWTQLAAAALVMACGIATLTMSLSALTSIQTARETYYRQYRFPDVFAHVKRAPNALLDQVAEIPGVARVHGRIVVDVNLDVPGLAEPAVGRLISIPPEAPFGIVELHLRAGRLPQPGRGNEVAASEAFVQAHHLELNSSIDAIINGRLEQIRIVGVALSPEFVYQVRPGELLPDDRRFGVFWMSREDLGPAFDLDGAFNDLVLILTHDSVPQMVIQRLDQLTAEYGGQGAYDRNEQTSDKFLSNELNQLRAMSLLPPSIFLSATAFILNIVFSRLVRTQREQIAVLKAFGYKPLTIGVHYMQMAMLTATVGSVIGLAVGWALGRELTIMYARFFRFPVFNFHFEERAVFFALAFAVGAAIIGTMTAVRSAIILPPAQAMRPEVPPDYRESLLERLRLQRLFSPAGRMIVRHLERQPLRALMTIFGISLAAAVLIVGSFMQGALDHLIDFMFFTAQRQDITVTLNESASPKAIHEIEKLPGVLMSESFRSVPARIRAGSRSRLQGVLGLQPDPQLNRVVDDHGNPVLLPHEGLLVSDILAEVLHIQPGDRVVLEILSDQRPTIEVPVTAIVSTYVGTAAYMDINALHRLMKEDDVISGAYLRADPDATPQLYRMLKTIPNVASVTIKSAALESFNDTIAENILRMRLFNLMFATIIAFGVIYNSARIALAERSHELATMRVLGFTRVECSMVLLGELAILTIASLIPGMLLGSALAAFITSITGGETVRIPFVISPGTYGFAAVVVLTAAIVSGMIVRSRVDHLDLVEVLKTKA